MRNLIQEQAYEWLPFPLCQSRYREQTARKKRIEVGEGQGNSYPLSLLPPSATTTRWIRTKASCTSRQMRHCVAFSTCGLPCTPLKDGTETFANGYQRTTIRWSSCCLSLI